MKRLIAAIILVLILAGCELTTTTKKVTTSSPKKVSTPTASTGVQPVEVTLSAERSGEDIVISGTATVPDGALICYEVVHDYGDEPWPAEPYFTEGNIEVQNGRYSARVPGVPPGSNEVWVAFQTIVSGADQPAWVADTYGELGEKMKGDVTQSGNMTRVEKTVIVE